MTGVAKDVKLLAKVSENMLRHVEITNHTTANCLLLSSVPRS